MIEFVLNCISTYARKYWYNRQRTLESACTEISRNKSDRQDNHIVELTSAN